MLHVEIFYRAFCPSYVARPLSISSRCFLPAPLLCPPAVLLLSASFSLIQNHRALPSGGALRNFFAQGAFCSCCPLPPLPPHSQSPLLSPCAICLLPHLLLPLSRPLPPDPFLHQGDSSGGGNGKNLYACCVYLTPSPQAANSRRARKGGALSRDLAALSRTDLASRPRTDHLVLISQTHLAPISQSRSTILC